jgi:hypothetical protein
MIYKGGNMNEQEREMLAGLLQNNLSGVEKKIIIEKISGRVVQDGDDLIQIDKDCHLDESGGIREINIFRIKVFACGCRADGRNNLGGVDYKGNIVCSRHFYRCIRCRKPLSSLTVKSINGFCYCARCHRIVKILRFFGLKK